MSEPRTVYVTGFSDGAYSAYFAEPVRFVARTRQEALDKAQAWVDIPSCEPDVVDLQRREPKT